MTQSIMRDVIVIGGGPGGTAVATLLTSQGHDVALLTRPTPTVAWLAESIPASARKLLIQVGALEAVEAARFIPNEGNMVWWAGGPERLEQFPRGQSGFHVDRGGLEGALLDLANKVGTFVCSDAPVRSVTKEPEGWHVEAGTSTHRARWVLDASGRSGVVARHDMRIRERDTTTLALVGQWEDTAPDAEDPSLTLVESYKDGWAWSVPTSETTRCVTVMVDPRRTEMRRELGLDGMLRSELAKAHQLSDRLSRGRVIGSTRACAASVYGASKFGQPGLLLVGDAGSAIDPLSSYGVKKALSSAWLAAVVVHTALSDETMANTAIDFFDAREKEVYETYRARSVPFLEEALDAHGHAFWEARVIAARAASGTESKHVHDGTIDDPYDRANAEREAEKFVGDPVVRTVYEEIRTRPNIALQPGPTLGITTKPAVVGNQIALEPHLTSKTLPQGTRFIRNVDLRRLVELAPHQTQVPDFFSAYNAAGTPADLADFLAALAATVGAGFLKLDEAPNEN